ncbi:Methionyl-tRNA formyltransferase [Methanosarcina sp. MTP4]|uniref:formyltransferase family protein n=1 Tax=Methanosarcina sp. MTP4 TaxID=1434100 RepID=UPI000615EA24|nr:formyltransferase family protein [Methanosarcina sp. MTP4]AKB23623.1 Methionyl-tRNA formyltransferase [Methanosarcina sp. MTP4]
MLASNNKKNVIFLAPSSAIKPFIVAQNVLKNEIYNRFYDTKFVVDTKNGKLVDYLNKNKIQYESIENSGAMGSAIASLLRGSKNVDIIVSCGWGKKIPNDIIKMPEIAAINCHSSYLPDYKGGSVYLYQWANLEKHGGATIHFLSSEFDSGNIICRKKFEIKVKDSPDDILIKASELTADLLLEAIELLEKGYKGFDNKGGRYFMKTRFLTLRLHRITNLLLSLFSDKRWRTRWK